MNLNPLGLAALPHRRTASHVCLQGATRCQESQDKQQQISRASAATTRSGPHVANPAAVQCDRAAEALHPSRPFHACQAAAAAGPAESSSGEQRCSDNRECGDDATTPEPASYCCCESGKPASKRTPADSLLWRDGASSKSVSPAHHFGGDWHRRHIKVSAVLREGGVVSVQTTDHLTRGMYIRDGERDVWEIQEHSLCENGICPRKELVAGGMILTYYFNIAHALSCR